MAVARVVVLRRVAAGERFIQCHTDRRAPKIAEIRADPNVHWLFYDAPSRLQLRVSATAEVLTEGPEFERAWLDSTLDARRCYLAPSAPGTDCTQPSANLPESHLRRQPTLEESEGHDKGKDYASDAV